MALELKLDGYFKMEITTLGGNKLDKDIELGVGDDLILGEYTLDIENMEIVSIQDLHTPLYKFKMVPSINIEFEFDEI